MAYRGKRSGAGRKAGAIAKKMRKVPEGLTQGGGMTMLDIMVANARYFYRQAVDAEMLIEALGAARLAELGPEARFNAMLAEVKKAAGFRQLACQAAKDAARFLHAPIGAMQNGAADEIDDIPPVVERMKIYAREEAIAASAAAGKEVEITTDFRVVALWENPCDMYRQVGVQGHPEKSRNGRRALRCSSAV
jgi:hypothetical protein